MMLLCTTLYFSLIITMLMILLLVSFDVEIFLKTPECSERNHYGYVNAVCVLLLDFSHLFGVPHRQVRVSAHDPRGAASEH